MHASLHLKALIGLFCILLFPYDLRPATFWTCHVGIPNWLTLNQTFITRPPPKKIGSEKREFSLYTTVKNDFIYILITVNHQNKMSERMLHNLHFIEILK